MSIIKTIFLGCLLLLAAVGSYATYSFLSKPMHGDNHNMSRTLSDLEAIENILRLYKLDVGHFPTTEEGLGILVGGRPDVVVPKGYSHDGYIERLPTDRWGEYYQYINPQSDAEEVYICSRGSIQQYKMNICKMLKKSAD